jgi:hypothetical protein
VRSATRRPPRHAARRSDRWRRSACTTNRTMPSDMERRLEREFAITCPAKEAAPRTRPGCTSCAIYICRDYAARDVATSATNGRRAASPGSQRQTFYTLRQGKSHRLDPEEGVLREGASFPTRVGTSGGTIGRASVDTPCETRSRHKPRQIPSRCQTYLHTFGPRSNPPIPRDSGRDHDVTRYRRMGYARSIAADIHLAMPLLMTGHKAIAHNAFFFGGLGTCRI